MVESTEYKIIKKITIEDAEILNSLGYIIVIENGLVKNIVKED
jgi:hypothetical protein